ncbi:MAG TPA: phosphotransferase [Armatimonadota bacterium]|jgi:hypothetical protein
MNQAPTRETLARLLAHAGLAGVPHLEPLTGGANNRVFRVEVGGRKVALKVYFRHPEDLRDRLGAEWAFLSFAWDHGLRCVPQPLACDRAGNAALYEYVCGERLVSGEVGREELGQALALYRALHRLQPLPEASALPPASEACFTLADHRECVARRVRRLAEVTGGEAQSFVREELAPACERVAGALEGREAELALPEADHCLSPSDFGFHNALREAGGRLRFLDFEYAGWDDPAKLVGDFFCQPAVPVPPELYPEFAGAVAAELSDPGLHLARCGALLPLYRLKWCCILLNGLLPEGSARRRFAAGEGPAPESAARQLTAARALLRRAQSDLDSPGAVTP